MRSVLICLLLLTPVLHAMEEESSSSSSESTSEQQELESSPSQKALWALPHIFTLTNGFSEVEEKAFRRIANLMCKRIRHSPDWIKRDASFVRCEDGKVRRRDRKAGNVIQEGWYANAMAFSHDRSRLAVADGQDTHIFDTQTGEKKCTIPSLPAAPGFAANVISFSRDGKQIAIAYGHNAAIGISDAQTGSKKCVIDAGDCGAEAIVFNHDGTLIAISRRVGEIRIINTQTGTIQYTYGGGPIFADGAFVFNHDSTLLAGAGKILDATNAGAMVHNYIWSSRSLAFNHDGTQLAYIRPDRDQLTLIDVTTGQQKKMVFSSHTDGDPRCLAYNYDGTQIVVLCGDNSVRIIDSNTRTIKHTITLESLVRAIGFGPDATAVYAACDDGTLHIFDINQSERIVRQFSLDQCELLGALALAARDSEELAFERAALQSKEAEQSGFRQKALQKFGFGPEKQPHKIARINASEEHWEAWLRLREKLPERIVRRFTPYIVRGDDNPDGYETAEEHD